MIVEWLIVMALIACGAYRLGMNRGWRDRSRVVEIDREHAAYQKRLSLSLKERSR